MNVVIIIIIIMRGSILVLIDYIGVYLYTKDVSFTRIIYYIGTAGKLSWLRISAESI